MWGISVVKAVRHFAVSEEDFVNLYCECLCLINTLSGHTRHAVPCLGVLAYEHSPIQEVVIYSELVCKLSIHRKNLVAPLVLFAAGQCSAALM